MRTSRKLLASLTVLIGSVLLLRVNGWFGLGFVVALPLSILYWLDYGTELRQISRPSRARRLLAFVVGVPQVLFGLVSLVSGVSIVAWVLYNSFWEKQPEYTGGFLTIGIGPLLVLFGSGLVASAFRTRPARDEA